MRHGSDVSVCRTRGSVTPIDLMIESQLGRIVTSKGAGILSMMLGAEADEIIRVVNASVEAGIESVLRSL